VTQAPRIVGFGGTLSKTSTTTAALRAVLDAAASNGGNVELVELGALGLPSYEWGIEAPPAALAFADALYSADALVWASPLYHGTVSGLFKNAIDWLEILHDRTPAYLTDKPVGLIGVAAGGHALSAIGTMEQIVRSLRGWTVPLVVPINRAADVFERDGSVKPGRTAEQLAALGGELVRAANLFRAQPRR
jgi:FMN reductase